MEKKKAGVHKPNVDRRANISVGNLLLECGEDILFFFFFFRKRFVTKFFDVICVQSRPVTIVNQGE
jgi:hypothetical protein